MGIVEVDMYVNQFKVFFDKNPDDLTELIGDILVSDFYNEVKTQSSLNYENGDEVSLKELRGNKSQGHLATLATTK